ncbi:hypothetical protein DENSPDRAFT_934107 [Dentipellis sp. KUC8613]|nr:hypothetical protein DENSPDRAFT_934107 [Dentipellis sp. KUC8613]
MPSLTSPFTGNQLVHIPAFHIYHYRDLYFICDRRDPSEPKPSSIELDLSALMKFPSTSRASECFSLWLQVRSMALDQKLDMHKKAIAQAGGADYLDVPIDGFWISKEPERRCKRSCSPVHIFEIDLDWLTFSIDNTPVFRLDDMPPGPILSNIGRHSYGHIAPKLAVPRKHWYEWKTDPPQVDGRLLWEYDHLCNGGPLLPIHELLGVEEPHSPQESVRVRLLEVLVSHLLLSPENARALRELPKVPSRDQLPMYTGSILMTMLVSVTGPYPRYHLPPSNPEYSYDLADLLQVSPLRRNVYLILWTHLDDGANLHAAAVHLVREVKRINLPLRMVYGILFSGSHVVIVKIDLNAGGKIAHTPALPFLPDNFARSPSTPGITALGRLLSLEDPDIARKPNEESRLGLASLYPRTARLSTDPLNEIIMPVKGRNVRLLSVLPHESVDNDIMFEGCRLDPAVFGASFLGILDDGTHVAVLVDRTADVTQVPLAFTLHEVRII